MHTDAIAEYRASVDAAEAVTFAEGLRVELLALVASGEILEELYLEACASGLDEIRERAGSDAALHRRKAGRLINALVIANTGIVRDVAKRTLGSRAGIAANLEEAMQEGKIGLVRAIEGYDPSRGKFSTWAAFQIRHFVQTCMHKQVDFARQRSAMMPPRVVKAVNKFRLLNGREPKPEELTYKTAEGDTKTVTAEQWTRWLDVTHTVSVDAMSGSDDGAPGADQLVDEKQNPESEISNLHLRDKLATELATMSPRNRELTKALFIEGRAYPDVAEQFGLCPQRIHQLKGVLEKRLRKVLAA